MTQRILRIDASMRKNGSYSRSLADALIEQLNPKQSNQIIHRDLADGLPFVDENWINANFTAQAERTPVQQAYLSLSDRLIEELKNADQIIVALPIYNFGVPAAFKAWIDLVARSKKTFKYTENGPIGLLENKNVYVIMTSGGTKLGSELDFISAYLHHIFAFIGLTSLTLIDSTSLGSDVDRVLSKAKEQINSQYRE